MLIISGFNLVLRSQTLPYVHWTVDKGLPSNEAYHVYQDRRGYIWICTDFGLMRYDGQQIKIFSSEDGLLHNTVFRVWEDYQGRLWITGLDGGLCYLWREKIYAWSGNEVLSHLLGENFPLDVHVGLGDSLWLTAQNLAYTTGDLRHGLYGGRIEGKEVGQDERFAWWSASRIGARHLTQGLVTVLGGDTLERPLRLGSFPSSRQEASLVPPMRWTNLGGGLWYLGNYAAWIRRVAGTGDYWAINQSYLARYEASGCLQSCVRIEGNLPPLLCALADGDRGWWLGTESGLYRIDWAGKVRERWFEGEYITHLLQDREGNFWLSTLRNGVYTFAEPSLRCHYEGQSFTSLRAWGGALYLGTKEGELWRFSPKNKEAEILDYGKVLSFSQSFVDSSRGWLCLGNNYAYDLKANKGQGLWFKGGYQAKQMAFWQGYVLLGHVQGFSVYQGDSCIFRSREQNFNERVHYVFSMGGGRFLLSSMRGAYVFDVKQTRLEALWEIYPLLKNRIAAACWGTDGRLYLASRGGGLLIWDLKRGEVKQMGKAQGLTSVQLQSLCLGPNAQIWLGSNQGLDQIELGLGDEVCNILHLSSKDLLSSNAVHALHYADNLLWVASDRGLMEIPLKALSQPKLFPPWLSGLRVNGQDLVWDREDLLRLDSDTKYLEFNFEAPRLRQVEQLRYRYRLLGLDSTWYLSEQKGIQYAHLAPGFYRFELSLQTGPSQHSSTMVLRFQILAPWWQRAEVWIMAFVGFILLCSILLAWVQERAWLGHRLLQAEQKALRAQINPHFIANALNSILLFVRKHEASIASRYLARFAALFRHTFDNAQSDWISLEQELKTLRLYLDLEFLRLGGAEDYFDLNCEAKEPWPLLPPMLLQPFVENAILHGLNPKRQGARILLLRAWIEQGRLKIEIQDNGIGRQAAEAIKINREWYQAKETRASGQQNSLERIALLNRYHGFKIECQIMDLFGPENQASGTKVSLSLPLRYETKT